jgi:CubicO group peptidase (beta-lactamase class C family)
VLADMVQRGDVRLTDPVSSLLPPNVKVPSRNGRAITLEDLATHSSGLPREATNLRPKNALFVVCFANRQRGAGTRRVHELRHAGVRAGTEDTSRRPDLQGERCPRVSGRARQYRPRW